MTTGEMLIIEIKGRDMGDFEIKTAAAQRWVDAVNRDGRFGQWQYHPITNPPELGMLLESALATAH